MLYQTGEKYPRESQRTADTELPAVDRRAAARNPFAGLPFVRTAHTDAECLPSSEYIPFGNAENGARSCLVIALGSHVQFQFAIQRKVVNGVDLQVQRIATAGGIFGDILHFRITENAETGEAGLGLFLPLLRIEIAGAEFQPVVQHLRTDTQLPFVKDGHIFIPDGICRWLVVVAVQEYRYVAYLPGAQYGAWQPWLCGDTERYLSGIHDRIGLVADKFGTEIVIPVVTEQGRDALAFGFELYDIEIISVAQKPVADVALDECVDAMP